ncbi:acyl-CoA dehydrogenase family protein [Streptomyces sp. NPDC020141]|uniref:acyl-CoA dehydrogenase family protein n=1 Tax=Streptomyces sp. NPDC020141 TaxID=3365065 RepID=UPI0037942F1A
MCTAATACDAGAADVLGRFATAEPSATGTARYAVDTAGRPHGARALRRGHPPERLYREVRAPRIHEGATDAQRPIIAERLYAEGPHAQDAQNAQNTEDAIQPDGKVV